MVRGKGAYLVWGVPLGAVLVGTLLGPAVRTLFWPPAFLVMGGACVVNAARCGRLHCFLTGPLYLVAALASLLVGLGVLGVSWGWIGYGVLVGTVVAYLPEWVRGRYVRTAEAR